jgi:hypothetical protein
MDVGQDGVSLGQFRQMTPGPGEKNFPGETVRNQENVWY